MNVDTKLREAGEALRTARRGEFTVRPPTTRRGRLNGPALAVAAAVVVVGALGVPAFLSGGAVSDLADIAENRNLPAASQPSDQVIPAAEPDDFPYLGLEIPDSVVYAAYDIEDEESGEKVGTHVEYLQTWTEADGEDVGRVIELRVQYTENEYSRFEDLVAAAESTSTVQAADRDVTLYVIPDEATDECCYDLGVLRWLETPGIEVIIIPWGLDGEEAVELLDSLQPLEANEWQDLTEARFTDAPTTTTTIVDSTDTTTMGRDT